MKNFVFLILFSVAIFSCKENAMPEPKNLIDKDVMVDILYDIAIIEAIKTSQPFSLQTKGIDAKTYIYKKYKIDSTQFAKSDKYYATDVAEFAKMHQKVVDKINEVKKADSLQMLPKPIKKRRKIKNV